ncbi:hypothetical protein DL96DRAFT_1685989 [Flagelloscypha sp. PMI_526]|nr:hypothetical protein DL96DRAFT_1685989 [Flagelloscypha sp. PMI_526]
MDYFAPLTLRFARIPSKTSQPRAQLSARRIRSEDGGHPVVQLQQTTHRSHKRNASFESSASLRPFLTSPPKASPSSCVLTLDCAISNVVPQFSPPASLLTLESVDEIQTPVSAVLDSFPLIILPGDETTETWDSIVDTKPGPSCGPSPPTRPPRPTAYEEDFSLFSDIPDLILDEPELSSVRTCQVPHNDQSTLQFATHKSYRPRFTPTELPPPILFPSRHCQIGFDAPDISPEFLNLTTPPTTVPTKPVHLDDPVHSSLLSSILNPVKPSPIPQPTAAAACPPSQRDAAPHRRAPTFTGDTPCRRKTKAPRPPRKPKRGGILLA